MCGIVGIAGKHDSATLSRMNALLAYRGPDDSGEYHDPPAQVTLAMRRLSILDLQSGHQPMISDDGNLVIVFNGEIFNSPQLRDQLERRGHNFLTRNSDTEVVLKLYEEKQADLLNDLNGMFAFAIYDKRRRVVFGARDRMGIKPLYYTLSPGSFAFSSELKTLLLLPSVDREIDLQSTFHYMTLQHIPGADSIFRDIKRLPPGHLFRYDLASGNLDISRYWQLTPRSEQTHSADEWAAMLRDQLREAFDRWTLSDVPVGCSLSGGLDSTAIVSVLGDMGHQLKTYSLGFAGDDEADWNELALAREVAKRWNTTHREIILEPAELLDDLVRMVWHLDEPYGGGLPSWYVFRMMSEDVKVSLTGSGGDELFGNYGKFECYEVSQLVRMIMKGSALARGGQLLPDALWAGWRKLLKSLPDSLIDETRKSRLAELDKLCEAPFGHYYYANQVYFSDRVKRESVFNGAASAAADTAAYMQALYERSGTSNPRDAVACVDFQTQLPDEFLLMTDRFSMAHSLEARVPFLDHQLVEFVFSIPAETRTQRGALKYLLKKAVGDLLPESIQQSRKRGFVIPIKLWLRRELRPLAERLLAPERLAKQEIFRPSFYVDFVRPHLEGRADFTWQVWSALMFQLWHHVYIEEKSVEKPSYSWRDLV